MTHVYQSIIDLLREQAQYHPDKLAILAPNRPGLTYARLLKHVEATVQTLNNLGLQRNDRVAIVLPNGPEMAVSFLSVAAGMTIAPLNPLYQASEYDFYLTDLNAKVLITQHGMESLAREVAQRQDIQVIELLPSNEAEAGIFSLLAEPNYSTEDSEATFASRDDIALVLHTSGTTARPKLVPLAQRNLLASAYNVQQALALTPDDRCLNIMPLFHIHGLIAAVLSTLVAGASIVCTEGFYASVFFERMQTFDPTWYTAVPTMHQSILAHAAAHTDVIKASPLRLIRSSSAPLPPSVMSQLETAFNVPIIEAYGMTEAAHQITSNPLPPSVRKPGSVGLAAGPQVAIMTADGKLLSGAETGEIAIRGANITPGYENNPTANASTFSNGWFRTGDQGYLDADGYLFITGRLKEIINRGGQKISPREVDEILLQHPAVAQAVTFAVPHPTLGEDVAAAVVLKQQVNLTAAELRVYAASYLAYHKVPHQILFLDDLPKGPTGKLQRIGLAKQLGLLETVDARVSAVFVAPRTPLEQAIANIWCEVLRLETVSVFDNFIALGGDSMSAIQVVARLRNVTQTGISLVNFLETPTVADMAIVIISEQINALPASEIVQLFSDLDAFSDTQV